jgi:hypothetical protein
MAATKAPLARIPTQAEPVLDRFYNLKQAAVRLGLATEDPEDEAGQRWLMDGFRRPLDGSKGRPFPGRKMSGRLIFSESDLATIAQIALEETQAKKRADETPQPSTGRPRRIRKTPALAGS